jgi:multidrug efflux pump
VASVYFVPYLGRWLRTRAARCRATAHELFDTPFYSALPPLVNWCVAHRWITIGATIALFVLGVAGMGRVQQQFFPDSSRPEILVDLWLPEGSTLHRTRLAKRFEAAHGASPRCSRSPPGSAPACRASTCRWTRSSAPATSASHRAAQVAGRAREALRRKLPRCWPTSSDVRARVKLLPNGPPVPYPVQFRVMGDDPLVRQWADRRQGGDACQPQPCAA